MLDRHRLSSILATGATLVLAAGCGGEDDDRISKQQLRDRLAQADRAVSRAFEDVEEAGRADAVRQALERLARTERRQIERLEEGDPPEEAERLLDQLLEGARKQATQFERTARRRDLTPERLERIFSGETEADRQVESALEQLQARGFAPRQDG